MARPIEKGNKNPGIPKGIMIEYEGSYYYPGDFGFYVDLWHPDKQAFQESAPTSHDSDRIHWRPIYKFSEDEVWNALVILCKHYKWCLERGKDNVWKTLRCGHGSCTFG